MLELLADRTKLMDASGIRKVFALAADLKDPVNLSIGQPDFDVPQQVKQAAVTAIESGCNSYSQTPGLQELKDAVIAKETSRLHWDNPEVFISSGVSGALFLTFLALINPGDEVVIPDPYFVIYKQVINMLGGKCVFVDTYPDFRMTPEKVEAVVTDKTKLIIINTPANPTGVVSTEDELKGIADIAAGRGILVMSDEIYEDFCYDGPSPSIAKFYDKTILMKGFSKNCAMTGWRLGYVVVSQELKPLMNELAKLQQYTYVCAPTPLQKAAITALTVDVSEHVADYARRRDMLVEGLSDKFEFVRPGGAFYMFIKAPGNLSGTDFVTRAIENNLLIIPGGVFSERDTHFRLSYANSPDKLKKGIEILNSIA
ncbi:Putative N-acetyl-LL-diaminopimelate aminotransferase [Limihaloglobus sulfuriphilus]|uniref:Aminotransferase n=1 Tax=Limihaloglobus sulfuriphilus TaxID=1851148 RepID=A0A1Q2MI96_9BACT|nr:aminotransferase class I/II-fold pyridoxal phosphate-dependent enzyme [Limihaloglobus sulfuriphilus]AQQ72248.1 Putative N-acetyl-LL-diaminopimelate aminotransferase [Limihaloglobus sulfuriphilus]